MSIANGVAANGTLLPASAHFREGMSAFAYGPPVPNSPILCTAPALTVFLQKHNPDFFTAQTVAPSVVVADPSGPGWALLSWVPVDYRENGGYYEVSYATDENGPYLVAGTTDDNWAETYTVEGLDPGTRYCFRLRNFTPSHDVQQNNLWSEYTSPLAVTVPESALFLPLLLR